MGSAKKQIESHYKEPETPLARYAKAIAAVVEAGGPRPRKPIYINSEQGVLVSTPFGSVFNKEMYAVPHLEKYVREDVVVWFQNQEGRHSKLPTLIGTGRWTWTVGRKGKPHIVGGDECPTEAHTAFLEAIASVVAGEKGEVG